MLKAILEDLQTGERIEVFASTETPDSSYGLAVWIDSKRNTYGQVIFGDPPGYRIFKQWKSEDVQEINIEITRKETGQG